MRNDIRGMIRELHDAGKTDEELAAFLKASILAAIKSRRWSDEWMKEMTTAMHTIREQGSKALLSN